MMDVVLLKEPFVDKIKFNTETRFCSSREKDAETHQFSIQMSESGDLPLF